MMFPLPRRLFPAEHHERKTNTLNASWLRGEKEREREKEKKKDFKRVVEKREKPVFFPKSGAQG